MNKSAIFSLFVEAALSNLISPEAEKLLKLYFTSIVITILNK